MRDAVQAAVNDLPQELCRRLQEHWDQFDYDAVDRALQDEGLPEAAALVLRAYNRFQYAMEIMVDRVAPLSGEALELLAQARAAGATGPAIDQMGAELHQAKARAEAEDAAAHEAALAPDATADQLAGRAHLLSQQGEHREAADLFLAAARRAAEEAAAPGAEGEPDQSPNYRVRAGTSLASAGDREEARPLLEEFLDFDWRGAGLFHDRHMTEGAFLELLRWHAQDGDAAAFRRTFARACRRGHEIDWPFPGIRPHQAELLDLCAALGADAEAKEVAEVVLAAAPPAPPDLAARAREVLSS